MPEQLGIMLNLLIVDDDDLKRKKIVDSIRAVHGFSGSSIETAGDVFSAKRLLANSQFDLLILDLQLPDRPNAPINRDGGRDLIREVIKTNTLKKPKHVIGLTAFDESLLSAEPDFAEHLWWIIKYDISSNNWQERLENKISYLLGASEDSAKTPDAYEYDVACVTALNSPEFKSIQGLPLTWDSRRISGDSTEYLTSRLPTANGDLRVVAASAYQMGMPSAAVLGMKLIQHFRPRFLAITGIAAGIRDHANYGDILVAEQSWDYNSGKLRRNSAGSDYFESDPKSLNLHTAVRERLAKLARERTFLDEIRNSWPGEKPTSALELRLGPVVSGSAVIANSEMVKRLQGQSRKIVGIEMETYGVFYAAENCSKPRPVALSLKSVCDFADETKDDRFQAYAAFTSANYFFRFVKSEIPTLLHAI